MSAWRSRSRLVGLGLSVGLGLAFAVVVLGLSAARPVSAQGPVVTPVIVTPAPVLPIGYLPPGVNLACGQVEVSGCISETFCSIGDTLVMSATAGPGAGGTVTPTEPAPSGLGYDVTREPVVSGQGYAVTVYLDGWYDYTSNSVGLYFEYKTTNGWPTFDVYMPMTTTALAEVSSITFRQCPNGGLLPAGYDGASDPGIPRTTWCPEAGPCSDRQAWTSWWSDGCFYTRHTQEVGGAWHHLGDVHTHQQVTRPSNNQETQYYFEWTQEIVSINGIPVESSEPGGT